MFYKSHTTLALRNNELVHISQIDVPSGLQCNATCLNCKARLIAKKGKLNKHHFAHEHHSEDCGKGQESAIHFLSKKTVSEMKYIRVKETVMNKEYRLKGEVRYTSEFFPAVEYLPILNVRMEEKQKVDGFIPDICCTLMSDNIFTNKNTKVYLEIENTHASSEEKKHTKSVDLIFKLDVSDLYERSLECDSYQEIEDLIREKLKTRFWVIEGGRLFMVKQRKIEKDALTIENNELTLSEIAKIDDNKTLFKQQFIGCEEDKITGYITLTTTKHDKFQVCKDYIEEFKRRHLAVLKERLKESPLPAMYTGATWSGSLYIKSFIPLEAI